MYNALITAIKAIIVQQCKFRYNNMYMSYPWTVTVDIANKM